MWDGRHLAWLHRRRRRRCRAYAPTSNTASHANHEKINSWVSFSFLYGYGLQCTSLTLDLHVMINWHLSKQGICWSVSRDPIAGSSLQLIEVMCFFEVDRWPSAGFSIGSRAHASLTCSKQDRIVRKPVNASPGLKFIRIIPYKTQIKILPFPSWVSLIGDWTARARSYAFRLG